MPNMTTFQNTLDDLELYDLGFSGSYYTWQRGNSIATRIRERLDMFSGSTSWTIKLFPEFGVEHLLRYNSDH